MITPKRAAELAEEETSTSDAAALAAQMEPAVDRLLIQQKRSALSCSTSPPSGALLAAPATIMELERRYRATGWVTRIDGGTLWIEAPTVTATPGEIEPWFCQQCGAMTQGEHCLGCQGARAEGA